MIVSAMAAGAVAFAQKPPAGRKPVAPLAKGFAAVDKVIHTKCIGCHQGVAPAGGVKLTSYADVMKSKFKGKPIVVAKDLKKSVLVHALHGKGVQRMPPGGALSPAEIKAVEAWIAAGAKK